MLEAGHISFTVPATGRLFGCISRQLSGKGPRSIYLPFVHQSFIWSCFYHPVLIVSISRFKRISGQQRNELSLSYAPACSMSTTQGTHGVNAFVLPSISIS